MDSTLVVIGSGMGNASNHSNRDLPVLLAGGGLKHQGHLVCPGEAGNGSSCAISGYQHSSGSAWSASASDGAPGRFRR